MVTVEATPVLQNFWKNTGKKPAMTVVANAEFAQSYSAQAKMGLFFSNSFMTEGYAGHTAAIFALVGRHLREAGAAKDDESAKELATALWSGAHGICMLAVTGKLQVATQASVQRLLDVLLDKFLTSADSKSPGSRARKSK